MNSNVVLIVAGVCTLVGSFMPTTERYQCMLSGLLTGIAIGMFIAVASL